MNNTELFAKHIYHNRKHDFPFRLRRPWTLFVCSEKRRQGKKGRWGEMRREKRNNVGCWTLCGTKAVCLGLTCLIIFNFYFFEYLEKQTITWKFWPSHRSVKLSNSPGSVEEFFEDNTKPTIYKVIVNFLKTFMPFSYICSKIGEISEVIFGETLPVFSSNK